MTNAQIIMNASIELMKAGKLNGTGEFATFEDENGNEIKVELPEQIHTFAAWKELGYSVKRGEHSDIRITIWKAGKKKDEQEDDGSIKVGKQRMFLKEACFFRACQVEKIS